MTPIPDTWQELLTLIIPALLTVLGFIDKKRGWVWRDKAIVLMRLAKEAIAIYRQIHRVRHQLKQCDQIAHSMDSLSPDDPRSAGLLDRGQEAGLAAVEMKAAIEKQVSALADQHPRVANFLKSKLGN